VIFIIGGNGFVGSAFTRYCEAQGLEHSVITRENYNNFVGHSCQILINANGNSKKYLADERELEDFDASVRSVRASLVDFRYELYVYISSCDVYADHANPETTREDAPILANQQSKYGFHKYLAEQCVQKIANQWLIFRMGGFVGPALKKNPIFDILRGGPLWLDQESELQYMNTDDAARIVFELINKRFRDQIFNLCGDGLIKLKDVVKMVKRPVSMAEKAPCVRYEINIEKAKQKVAIPSTKEAVKEFVQRSS
jgi:nucleoside-diphosphate-sugar epimerase